MEFANFEVVLRIFRCPRSPGGREIEKDITSPGGLMLMSAGKADFKGLHREHGKDGHILKGTKERGG